MKKFEYKVEIGAERFLDENMLNMYGEQGWELVSFIYPVKPWGSGIGTKTALYIFKREAGEVEEEDDISE